MGRSRFDSFNTYEVRDKKKKETREGRGTRDRGTIVVESGDGGVLCQSHSTLEKQG